MEPTTELRTASGKAEKIESYLLQKGKDLETVAQGKPVPLRYLLPAVRRNTDDRRYNRRPLAGVRTGIAPLDIAFRGGYQKSFLYIWLGLQGGGKTNWLVWSLLQASLQSLAEYNEAVALAVSRNEDPKYIKPKAILIHEMEMQATEIYERLAAMISGVSSMYIALGGVYNQAGQFVRSIRDDEYETWYHALDAVTDFPILIQEGKVSAEDVLDSVCEVKAKGQEVMLATVDYLQIALGDGDKYAKVSKTASDLRDLALMEKIPVLTCCQVNRTVHDSPDKKIQAHMALGTSDIESFATHLCAWNNANMLLPRDQQPAIAEGTFDILKNRTGFRTEFPVTMDTATGAFGVPQTVDSLLGEEDI